MQVPEVIIIDISTLLVVHQSTELQTQSALFLNKLGSL